MKQESTERDARSQTLRRMVDIAVAVTALVTLSPIFLILAVAVRVSSGSPIFYGGVRIGRGGREFRMWKFRSMKVGSDALGSVSGPQDMRITRVGALLRATKLDELPQFFNLLVGDITLVGPRPEVPQLIARYTGRQRDILRYTPGITSPGEIYFTEVQEQTIPADCDPDEYFYTHLLDEKLTIDFEYFQHQSYRRDVLLVLKTARVMARGLQR